MIGGTRTISLILTRLVEWILAWPKVTVATALVLAVLCVDYAGDHLGINTDTANMISPELPWRQEFIAYRESFPIRDRNIVIVIDGPSSDATDEFGRLLAERLRSEPDLFQAVFLPGDGEFFDKNGLLYLALPDLQALSDRLIEAQPLLGLLKSRFNGAGIVAVVEETGSAVGGGSSARSDELAVLYEELAASLEASAAGRRDRIAWERLLSGTEPAAGRSLILLRPELEFDRIQPARGAIARIRAIVEELRPSGVDVRLTGTVAMEHEELQSVTRGAGVAGVAALVLVTLVLLWALRSVALMLMSVATLLVGLSFTAAFAGFAVGHLNLLSVAFAVLYVGLGVDFILHICLRFKELVAQGLGAHAALVETVHGVGTSLVICAVTTAAGFYAFIPTPFDGVSELGLISGTGMFISLLASITLLPALLVLFDRFRSPRSRLSASPALAVRFWNPAPARVVIVAAAVGIASLASLPRVTFDSNPIHLRDPESESIRALEDLAAESQAPLFNLVALADNREEAARWAAALAPLPAVDRVVGVDSLVPADQDEKVYVLEDLELVMGPGFADLEPQPLTPREFTAALRSLRAALAGLATPTRAQRRLLEAGTAWLASTDGRNDAELEPLVARLDEDLRGDLAQRLGRLAAGLHAEPFDRSALPPELTERWLNRAGQELIEIVPAENVNDNDAAQRFVSAVRDVIPSVTGLPVVYEEASATVVYSFELALSYAFVLVVLLLLLFFANLRDPILILVPILFAATATAGVAAWLGLPLNFANIIALPLLVGVGVDSGIHMVHRMRTEPPVEGEPLQTSTSRAVLASGLTTIASFGNLAFSTHRGMSSMGQLLTIGMAVTLMATLILLPALLKLKIGR